MLCTEKIVISDFQSDIFTFLTELDMYQVEPLEIHSGKVSGRFEKVALEESLQERRKLGMNISYVFFSYGSYQNQFANNTHSVQDRFDRMISMWSSIKYGKSGKSRRKIDIKLCSTTVE
jgi:hypothetical protein